MDAVLELDGGDLASLIGLVRQHTGIAMNEHKRVLLQGRLRPRMRALGLSSYRDYIARVRGGGTEVQAFVDLVTTNDTAFFRTPAVWGYLEREFLPQWLARCGDVVLQAWSAAAASGEEAYSLAMLCREFQERHPQFRFQIHATDISGAVLRTAAAGHYAGRSVTRLAETHPALLAKYLRPEGTGQRVLPELRERIRFGEHNLLAAPCRVARFDLVLLRNVLIYFDEEHQRRALHGVRAAMAPHARLLLGEQESITRIDTPFEFERMHVYRIRKEHA
ncbi:protein-glutamate O-methyltransferase CheR [Massilia forsythiae]|uniref:protein-glutamate O-methyltransferase n=1 Tax=Massilia forsythiae TaxID=2728020 RepID=A0A7Z2ZTV6_9BURK|nr:protein-glutamate O-methyltransferase CheR [Massilia forsythiae]QJE01918.1 protein-glutamate O-methyltransferase CheR [Massilia forsythiae]